MMDENTRAFFMHTRNARDSLDYAMDAMKTSVLSCADDLREAKQELDKAVSILEDEEAVNAQR